MSEPAFGQVAILFDKRTGNFRDLIFRVLKVAILKFSIYNVFRTHNEFQLQEL